MAVVLKKTKREAVFIIFGILFLIFSFLGVSVEKAEAVATGGTCLIDSNCDNPCDECVGLITGTCQPMAGLDGSKCGDNGGIKWGICSSNDRIEKNQTCTSSFGNRICDMIDPLSMVTCNGATPICQQTGSSVADYWAQCVAASPSPSPSPGGCTGTPPTLSVTPPGPIIMAGSQTFTMNITRGDTGAGCVSQTVPLQVACMGGNTPDWAMGSTSAISPGSNDTRTSTVNITASGYCTFLAYSPIDNSKMASQKVDFIIGGTPLPSPSAGPTPLPSMAPTTIIGCDSSPTCGSQCTSNIGSAITCSLTNSIVNAVCTEAPGCTMYTSGSSNCSCSSLSATPTSAPSGTPVPSSAASCSGPGLYRSPIKFCNIQELLLEATGWILGLVSSIIILILVIGGLMYVTSTGDEERLRTAKNIILYAIIGLGIILISYSLVVEVKSILNVP